MSIISNDISKAKAILEKEDLVAIPTETVYGLAGNAFSEKAIRKIFDTKKRPLFNPLIVHIHAAAVVSELAKDIPEKAYQLAQAFWPGSLTLVLKKKSVVPGLVTAGKDTVAIRVPNHPLTLELLRSLSFPLVAPSANPFGSISPTRAVHVAGYFENTLPLILDGGNCTSGIESTIIGFENQEPVLYRLGAISLEEIEAVIGKVIIKNHKESAPEAPGMLLKHYAPKTRTILVDSVKDFIQHAETEKIGVITFQQKISGTQIIHQEILSEQGDYKEAAANLYDAMHRLDTMKLNLIVAERFPEENLGKSINDRLTRATK
ncbi:L-threonylcarbamoyladenylate synthase [Flavobacterium sedimenticola]|uniref:Threonylcarbamoyl-AMP synthase n=1 Tax=Flavobacterium sedimenticola TaxID=3043286 RepID=A0ABT6XSZ0_9FLAO|nr:L-threonylcarbamoyladenylate synthase [Flavobacterium sedimenticola]MDI9258138.1 L-threonylcarbamoyladenylate synthase [Flavobacterium sedimenticola]